MSRQFSNEELITALRNNAWNRTAAARELGVPRINVSVRVHLLKKRGVRIPDSPVGRPKCIDVDALNRLIEESQ